MSISRIDPDQVLTSGVTSTSLKESWLKNAKRWELESILADLDYTSIVMKDIAEENLHQFTYLKEKVRPALRKIRGAISSNSHHITEKTKMDIVQVLHVIDCDLERVSKSLETLLVYAEDATDKSVMKLANNNIDEAKGITYDDICEWFMG